MVYKGMGGMVKYPKKIKTPSGSDERLIYANDDEIEMLRQAGGSGNMTPYGGIRSYEDDDSEDSTEDNTEQLTQDLKDVMESEDILTGW